MLKEKEKLKRERGIILNDKGLNKINDALTKEYEDKGVRRDFKEIATRMSKHSQMGSKDTVSNILRCKTGSDLSYVEALFKTFELKLEKDDWFFVKQQQEMEKPELPTSPSPSLDNPDDDPTDNPDEDSIDKDLYLERLAIEPRCYQAMLHPGCPIKIKAPWGMGKTWLMKKILYQAKKQGYLTVSLNFRSAEKEHLDSLDKFLRWFCACISKQLNELGLQVPLPNRLEDYWDNIFGSKVSCKDYFQKKLLEQISEKSILVLGLDNVDWLDTNREIASDFFDVLRDWCEEANHLKLWRKLRLVLTYSRIVHNSGIHMSPFNIGLPIELCEFELDEVQNLAKQNGLIWDKNQVQLLMEIVGGYPYLVQRAFEDIFHEYISLEDFLTTASTNSGIYRDHLQNHLLKLQGYPELKKLLINVVNATNSVQLEFQQALQLESMGLVKLDGNNATPRCKLYRQYFQKYL